MSYRFSLGSVLAIFATGILLCNQGPHTKSTSATPASDDKHVMIVFIHGTMLPLPNIQACKASLQQSFAKDQPNKKSLYQSYLDNLKQESIYCYQPSGADGLHPAENQQSARIASLMFQDFYKKPCSCYTFSWNGRLSSSRRKKTAQLLYQSLVTEITNLRKQHSNVEVVLICHSHGGNVALNLADVNPQDAGLTIDKLVLLGIPVQSETSDYIPHHRFKKVYNFYSRGDLVQKLDIVSTTDHASARTFKNHPNLIQIELSCGATQPRHNELWLFGGKNNWLYRHKKLSFAPFPFFVFLPIVLDQLDSAFLLSGNVSLNITKDSQKLHFSLSHQQQHLSYFLEQQALKKYHDMVVSQ